MNEYIKLRSTRTSQASAANSVDEVDENAFVVRGNGWEE